MPFVKKYLFGFIRLCGICVCVTSITFLAEADPCQKALSDKSKESVSPGSIVVNFVKKIPEKDLPSEFGEKWEKTVHSSFENWNTESVVELLGYLSGHFGKRNAVLPLKVPQIFITVDYNEFRRVAKDFEEEIGRKDTDKNRAREKALNRTLEHLKFISKYQDFVEQGEDGSNQEDPGVSDDMGAVGKDIT